MTRHFRYRTRAALIVLVLLVGTVPVALARKGPQSIEQKTRGMQRMDGFLPLYWDAGEGKLYMEVPRLGEEMIYVTSLVTGLGSNDIGLDRSQLGGERIVLFERVGPRILLVQPNYRFRAGSENEDERRAVEESFARSVLWGFEVAAQTDRRALVDATAFAIRDVHGAIGTLKSSGQGDYEMDGSRSVLYLPGTKGFPRNTEIEVSLTFTGDGPGPWVRDVAPTPQALTVRQRHSFVALPEPGYRPRPSDPRAGYFGIEYADYATPIREPILKRFISRHRLQKKDPSAAMSDPVAPIVYYLDRGAPEPIRSALLDGARWWNRAFEAAGYRNALRVELLPEGADPMDVRYNVIQWVHRATRGWSYGDEVIDPRTGEIIKGHVLLGSLRVRQDYLLAEGLLSPYADGDETPSGPERLALARLRQLSAHEVGHTLGLVHNYIASTRGRASVMDYPHPLAKLTDEGALDLSDAYDVGIGAWDEVAIAWGYQDFPEGADEAAELDRILTAARERGITFITDQDARPPGGAHPQAHLWDNAEDAAAELERMMKVRRAALDRFGENVVRRGMPLATMEEALVPLYLYHRYQLKACAKILGGQHYTYTLRGDGQEPLRTVSAGDQKRALTALLATLDPSELTLPAAVLQKLPPRPFTFPVHRELFPRYTGVVFDVVSPAAVAAQLSTSMILQPERAARLIEQHAMKPELPGLGEVIDGLLEATFGDLPANGYEAEIGRTVERVVVDELMKLAADAPMPQVRAVATLKLARLRGRLEREGGHMDEATTAHAFLLAADIRRFLEREYDPLKRVPAVEPPPGSPIGDSGPPP
ncbi:MAG: zinc-dependent metalloprotease [Acidobacteria bacterium]|nr:zinc-dependent metalloprotease [Acidobacteriota bacterium]